MIHAPNRIHAEGFQAAWLEAIRLLADGGWDRHNLVVHIDDPTLLHDDVHQQVCRFHEANGLLPPKHVAYTVFPHGLARKKGTASALFRAYNRERGLFDRVKTGWGTYFRRMTHYGEGGGVNQLQNIIEAIQTRIQTFRAAYTLIIPRPGSETIRSRGGPCLNYLALQLQPEPERRLGLLAVYRNHDFLTKAYGNYWGLCNLIRFLAKETGLGEGPLTCVSSHSFVADRKRALKELMESL